MFLLNYDSNERILRVCQRISKKFHFLAKFFRFWQNKISRGVGGLSRLRTFLGGVGEGLALPPKPPLNHLQIYCLNVNNQVNPRFLTQSTNYQIQWGPLNVITLGLIKSDNNNQMIKVFFISCSTS
jgi:hypothetical protein